MFDRTSDTAVNTASVESIPPPYTSPTIPPSAVIITPRIGPMTPNPVAYSRGRGGSRGSGEASGRPSDASPMALPPTPPSTPELGTEVSAARARFMDLVRSTIMVNRLIGIGDEAKVKASRSLTDGKAGVLKSAAPGIVVKSSRVAGLVSKLQNMTPTQDITAHAALVRHMQVSVNQTVTFAPITNNAPSSPRTESSWPPPVGTVPQLYSTLGYVAFTPSSTIN